MTTAEKLSFIETDFFRLLDGLHADVIAAWGKMNVQQMVEHIAAFFEVSTGKMQFDLVTPEEHLPKYKEFLYSEKVFRENTKAPLTVIGEEPLALKYENIEVAINSLKKSVEDFVQYFKNDPERKTLHPVFGQLNFVEWVLLHYKHVTHHLRQFGLETGLNN